MACSPYLTDISTSIWNDIGQPTDTPVSYIQSKLTSNAFLGKLNVLTANCYTIVSGDIAPPLGTDEQGIYAMLYEQDFYTRKINVLANGTDVAWVTIVDGESRITRSDTVSQMKLYATMQKQLNQQLNLAVAAYRQDNSIAQSVDYYDIDNGFNDGAVYPIGGTVYPTPG